MSPKAPPLPPGLGLLREAPMNEEPDSAKSKGKKSPTDRKTPTRKTPVRTPTKTTPTKMTPPKTSPRKTPTTPTKAGQKTPTMPAFPDSQSKPADPPKKTPSPVGSAGGRLSRGSRQMSRGRVSRASKKEVDIDAEDETRPFSQAHEEPLTQVEIETGEDTDRGQEGDSGRPDNVNESTA